MSTYKVIQDIEAEDKILGPLTLRQFIYALIAALFFYISFICLAKGVAYMLVVFLPPALFTGFFALPFGKDQPTEVWALAKIRFYLKPRKRIWDQSGMKELVTITVPKKVERTLTDGLSQNEVQSRLQALANTIDSRGWAIKNVNVNLYDQANNTIDSSDRLINIDSMPQEVPNYDVQAADDILDETGSNPIAQQFDQMINASTLSHRQQIVDKLNDTTPVKPVKGHAQSGDYWFLNQSSPHGQVVKPGDDDTAVPAGVATKDEMALASRLKAQRDSVQKLSYSHLRTIQPLNARQPNTQPAPADAQTDDTAAVGTVTAPPDPAILSLASNNDLNVATLAREAYKVKNPSEPPQDEVVISLH